jgi:hypothetical protein
MVLVALAAGCAGESTIRLPTRTPPAIARTHDEKVVFQSSAFVELHLWLVALATHADMHVPAPLVTARDAYFLAFRNVPTDALARTTTEALAACDDLPCAKAALVGARLGEAFAGAYPWFAKAIWPLAFAHADRALQRLRAALPDTMPALVDALAVELHAEIPSVVRLDVVHESPHFRDELHSPLALEDSEPCLRGKKEDGPEALACALFQAALALRDKSAIYRRLDSSLERDTGGRARANYLYALVAAHAVRIVARAGSHATRESYTARILANETEAEAFLSRRWGERTTEGFGRAFSAAVAR